MFLYQKRQRVIVYVYAWLELFLLSLLCSVWCVSQGLWITVTVVNINDKAPCCLATLADEVGRVELVLVYELLLVSCFLLCLCLLLFLWPQHSGKTADRTRRHTSSVCFPHLCPIFLSLQNIWAYFYSLKATTHMLFWILPDGDLMHNNLISFSLSNKNIVSWLITWCRMNYYIMIISYSKLICLSVNIHQTLLMVDKQVNLTVVEGC